MEKTKKFECELCAEKCCTLYVKQSVGMPFMCPFDSKVRSANWFEVVGGQNDTEGNMTKSCDTCGIKATFWCPCETRHTMQDCGEGTDYPYWQPKSDNAEEEECDE